MHAPGLVQAAHPLPTVAVTTLSTALAVAWGRDALGVLLVAATVLTGQLSIGWCDDATDVRKDAGRSDKPIPAGAVNVRTVWLAAVLALLSTVPLSFANGLSAGALHLVVVASGWGYALVLEHTLVSWLPYALAFGALPAFVHAGLPEAPVPGWWVVAAGALLGVGAHLANVLPDLEQDLAAGVRGWPQRLGARRARLLTPVPLVSAAVVLVFGPPGRPEAYAWVILGAVVVLAVAGGLAADKGPGARLPFAVALLIAVLAVALLMVA